MNFLTQGMPMLNTPLPREVFLRNAVSSLCCSVRKRPIEDGTRIPKRTINRHHPFGIPFGEVIIHGRKQSTITSEGIQIHRQWAVKVLPSPVCISSMER